MAINFRTNDVDSNTFARFPVSIRTNVFSFNSSNWSSLAIIAESDSEATLGYNIKNIILTTDDVIDNNIFFYLQKNVEAATEIPIGFCPVTTGAGTDGIENTISALFADTLEALTTIDNNGNPFISLGTEWRLLAKLAIAPSADKTIQVVTICNDY